METVILFGLVICFLMIGVPIAISLGLSSVLFLLWFSDSSLASVAATLFQAFEGHFTLMAIPFFILASAFMTTGGVARRIIRFSIACVGHLRGGLAISGVFACMMFAALSGSSPATVVAVGSIVIAGMMKVGYTKDFAAGVIANAGTLGILIPPSIVMVVYASTVEVSVGRMFLAGVIPGLLAGLMLMVAIYVFAVLRDLPKGEWPGWTEVAESILDAAFGLFLIVIILGGIYGGIFTPTEAAAVASVYAFFIAVFVYRDMGPLKGKSWLRPDEQARFGFGLRIVVFALVGFVLHIVASSTAEGATYPREVGLWVGTAWIVVTLVFGWALTQFQFHRGRIAFGLICLIGILPALIYIATNIGGLSSTVTGWMGAVTASTLLASLGAAALMLLWVLVVVVVLVLPPTIFAFSMTKASEDAAAVSEGFVTGVGGGVMSLLRGTGEGILWMLPSFVHHDTRKTLFEAGKLTITLLFVIANALILKHVLTDEQIPQKIAGAMLDAGFGPVMFLIMVNIILLIGGQFMEPSGLLVIVAPLVFPIAIELGIDPIHLGIIMVVNMEIGMITPPVGLNLFVTSGVANMPMMSVVRAALPFTAVLFVFLIIVTYVPALSTLLPNYFMGPEIITN